MSRYVFDATLEGSCLYRQQGGSLGLETELLCLQGFIDGLFCTNFLTKMLRQLELC